MGGWVGGGDIWYYVPHLSKSVMGVVPPGLRQVLLASIDVIISTQRYFSWNRLQNFPCISFSDFSLSSLDFTHHLSWADQIQIWHMTSLSSASPWLPERCKLSCWVRISLKAPLAILEVVEFLFGYASITLILERMCVMIKSDKGAKWTNCSNI